MFLTKVIFKLLLKSGTIVFLFFLLIYFGLNIITNHNDHQIVPNLIGTHIEDLDNIILENKLRYEIIDSSKFVDNFQPLTVISHIPSQGDEVKKNRKIYLTLNPSGYRKITIPNLIQITKRNAETIITSIGFNLGEITYKDDIGKDMVLEIYHEGEKVSPGTLLPKTSIIDLVLGNGKR